MPLDLSQFYPHYLFPFEAALQNGGQPHTAAELLESFLIDPDKNDPCWRWLLTLVKRRLDEGHDYAKAPASLANLLQHILHPLPSKFKILACEFQKINGLHGWDLPGKAQEIKITSEIDGTRIQKSIVSYQDSTRLLDFLFRRSLKLNFGTLNKFYLVDHRVSVLYGNGGPRYQAFLT